MVASRHALAVVVAVVAIAASAPSRADVVDDCIAASRAGQVAKKQGHLQQAAAQFGSCAKESCPAVVRADCGKSLDEVRALTPSLVLAAVDAGANDLVDVQVSVDGKLVLERITGQETPFDPGPHELEFALPSGEKTKVTVVARAGEKARRVVARFGQPPPPKEEASPPPPKETPSPPPPRQGSLALPLGLFGVAAASLGVAAYFQISGTAEVDDLRQRCGLRCPREDVEAVGDTRSQKELGARIALGVGVLAAGAAVYFLLTRSSPTNASASPARLGGFVLRF